VLIEVLVLQAMERVAQGDPPQALEKLAEALALAEPGGFIRPFLEKGPEMADLLGRIVELNPNHRYAVKILATFAGEKTEFFGRHAEARKVQGETLLDKVLIEPLTNREIEVLLKLAKGLSNKKIADSLYISPGTVKKHLYTIYRKLDVKNRHQAVIRAKAIGIL
jgi:LuxR family maltose regulon positive regulatory protein